MKFIVRNKEEWDIAQRRLLDAGYTWGYGTKVREYPYRKPTTTTIGIVDGTIWYSLVDRTGAVPVVTRKRILDLIKQYEQQTKTDATGRTNTGTDGVSNTTSTISDRN